MGDQQKKRMEGEGGGKGEVYFKQGGGRVAMREEVARSPRHGVD